MKKLIVLLCLTAMLSSCGNAEVKEKISGGNESSAPVQSAESSATPAYVVIPSGAEYIELKSSTENGSVLCRLYPNDQIIFNRSEQQWANVTANGFTGYIELGNVSFNAAEIPASTQPATQPAAPAETQPQVQVEQVPAETQAAAVQAMESGSQGINIENKIENTVKIEYSFDDFNIKYAQPLSYPKFVENKNEGYCVVESCYIFSEPSSNSDKDVKYMVYKDSGVEILGSVDDWYFIRRDFGSQSYRIGYVPKSYIALGKSPEAAPSLCSQVIVSKGSACINRYPKICEGSDVLGYAKQGQVYDVYDLIDNYWYEISYGSGYAYISHKMVDPY